MEHLLQHHDKILIIGAEKAQTNVFVKHEYTKPTLRKNGKCMGYMHSLYNFQFYKQTKILV